MRRRDEWDDEAGSPQQAFRAIYAAHVDAVLGYALRRVDQPVDAADVVAETFLVAWRRLADVPLGAERPWLYAVARRTLANQRRGSLRRSHLGGRLRVELTSAVPDHASDVVGRLDAEALLASLPAADREVLELSLWEGLEPREIAQVTGASALAVRTRLSRARTRLRQARRDDPDDRTGNEVDPPGHPPIDTPQLTWKEER